MRSQTSLTISLQPAHIVGLYFFREMLAARVGIKSCAAIQTFLHRPQSCWAWCTDLLRFIMPAFGWLMTCLQVLQTVFVVCLAHKASLVLCGSDAHAGTRTQGLSRIRLVAQAKFLWNICCNVSKTPASCSLHDICVNILGVSSCDTMPD